MKSITIKGSKRESVGKVSTKALRNAGNVPCVLYGGGEPLHFSALELDFSKLVYTPNAHTVVIEFDNGDKVNAILQDIQFHPLNDKILHVDFYRLFDNKEVSMKFDMPGIYLSVCSPHSFMGMIGLIIVGDDISTKEAIINYDIGGRSNKKLKNLLNSI